jgi:hypothetical protein
VGSSSGVRETARNVRWAALLVYAAAMPAYVYAFEHREDADYAREQGFDELLVVGTAAVLHVFMGPAVGEWRTVVAVLIPFVIAIPAGEYPGRWPEGPVAQTMLLQELVFGAPLLLLGVAVRRLLAGAAPRATSRRRRGAARSGSGRRTAR